MALDLMAIAEERLNLYDAIAAACRAESEEYTLNRISTQRVRGMVWMVKAIDELLRIASEMPRRYVDAPAAVAAVKAAIRLREREVRGAKAQAGQVAEEAGDPAIPF